MIYDYMIVYHIIPYCTILRRCRRPAWGEGEEVHVTDIINVRVLPSFQQPTFQNMTNNQ